MADYISKNEVLNLIMHNDKVCHYADERYENVVYATACRISDVVANMPAADVQSVVDTENMAIVSDEFICKKCGIYLKDYTKVVMDEDNDGYIDEQHYEYEPKFCPECGAKVESCIKTPKRDKPLYTMDEICKMNGIEFKGGEQNDKTRNV